MQVKKFLSTYSREYESYRTDWERHYYKGLSPSSAPAPEHQTHLKLSEFERVEDERQLDPLDNDDGDPED